MSEKTSSHGQFLYFPRGQPGHALKTGRLPINMTLGTAVHCVVVFGGCMVVFWVRSKNTVQNPTVTEIFTVQCGEYVLYGGQNWLGSIHRTPPCNVQQCPRYRTLSQGQLGCFNKIIKSHYLLLYNVIIMSFLHPNHVQIL